MNIFSLDNPTWIVAEVSANHNQSLELALALVEAAANSGADAVKFQTYRANTISVDCDAPDFMLPEESPWSRYKNYFALYDAAHTPWEWHEQLFNRANELGLVAFSSPFDETAVRYLEGINCPIYKVASPEIRHIPLIEAIASTGKPVIFSLGTATKDDFELALTTFRAISPAAVGVLQCDTEYPAKLERTNINLLGELAVGYQVVPGYSDHTLGNTAALVAVSKGAKILERHISSADHKSIDDFFSLNEKEFSSFVAAVRNVELALGNSGFREISEISGGNRSHRSIYPIKNIFKDQVVTTEDVSVVRPGFSEHPKHFKNILGKRATKDILIGERISVNDFI